MAVFNAGSIEATLDLDLDPFQRGLQVARNEGRKFGQERYTAKLDADTTLAARGANNARRSLERAEGTYRAKFEVTGLAEATAEAAGLKSVLDKVDGTRVTNVDSGAAAAAGLNRTRRGIMALLPALGILSTSLIPLTAAAVPVLGLANNLTLAAGAGGAAILAFQGVGEALKTSNEAAVAPTAENLAKMQAAMSKLTPDARAFVGILRDMATEGRGVQQAAANGLFPGLNAGLKATDLQQYERLLYLLGSAAGDNLGGALEALNDPRWRQFFGFLEAEAKPGVDALGQSVGNLAGFFASLWQAFDPLNDDFSDWLVRSTGDMQAWADALPDDPRFADFIAYVRESGPEAAATLGALGGALVDVVQAAAPLGGVTLDVLEAVGDAVSAIADSPFGPVLINGAAALYTFNRALAITDGLMKRSGMAAITGTGAAAMQQRQTALSGALQARTASVKGFGADLALLARARGTAGGLHGADEAAERVRSTAAGLAKAGAGLAAITAISTGATEALGLTQTATLGLAGAMAGPWGAAIGASIGLMLDYKSTLDSLRDSQTAYAAATRPEFTSFSQQQGATAALKSAQQADLNSLFGKAYIGPRADAQAEQAAAVAAATSRTADLRLAASDLAKQLGVVDTATASSKISVEQLDAALLKAQPAMAALGISTDDLAAAAANGSLPELIHDVIQWGVNADSAAGRTEAFGKTVADLGNDALRTADSASAMTAALEALLSPKLNLEAATDQWRTALIELEKQLKSGAGFEGFSKAARANREMTRGYTEDAMARLTALAGVSSTTEKDMAEAVAETRREFIQAGMAAGFSRKEIVARARAMGLTPKMVKTVFEAAGIDAADLKARELRDNYRSLPKNVQTAIRTEGVPKTNAEVDALVEKYKLTEKERRALVTLRDLATGPLQNVASWLNNIDGRTANATVRINTVGGAAAGAALAAAGLPRKAAGGPIVGRGTGTSDEIPIWASNGEHMWTAREVANAGGHAAVEAMRQHFRYAAGGAVGWKASASAMRGTSAVARTGIGSSDVDRLVEAILASRSTTVAVSSKEDLETALRALEAELRRR